MTDLQTDARAQKIAKLNDLLRSTFLIGGTVLFTSGFSSLDQVLQEIFIKKIQSFVNFTPDNDPYGERDFGMLEIGNTKIFWKIDYYDENLGYGSEDPADFEKTKRVLTIMLAEEY